MGYECPVCDVAQRDAEHLANHLAFSAMLHGDEHESFLDEHVPEWAQTGPTELAPVVAELATETDTEDVFEDTADHADHDHGSSPFDGRQVGGRQHPQSAAGGEHSDEVRAVLQEARELTEQMLADAGEETETRADTDAGDAGDDDGA
jgi:hypothetical protein